MGAWANITVSTLETHNLQGIEQGAETLPGIEYYLLAAKDTLRTRASDAVSPILAAYSISETAFFDALSSLASSDEQEALDTFSHLVRLLSLETLAGYYQDKESRAGRGDRETRRYQRYVRMVEAGLPHLARSIRECLASGALTLTSDGVVQEARVPWIL